MEVFSARSGFNWGCIFPLSLVDTHFLVRSVYKKYSNLYGFQIIFFLSGLCVKNSVGGLGVPRCVCVLQAILQAWSSWGEWAVLLERVSRIYRTAISYILRHPNWDVVLGQKVILFFEAWCGSGHVRLL